MTFFAPEFLLAGCLDSGLAGIVSCLIFIRMSLHEVCIDFGYISKKVSSCIERIFTYASCLAAESGELIGDLSELPVSLLRNLLDHHDCLPADLSAEQLVFGHLLLDEFRCDVQHAAEGQSVEGLDLTRGHHEVVRNLVADKNLSVAVMDYASGGVDGGIDHRIVLGVKLVVLVQNLDGEKFGYENGRRRAEADKKLVLPVEFHPSPPIFCRPVSALPPRSVTE